MRTHPLRPGWHYTSLCLVAALLAGCKTLPSNPVTEALSINTQPQSLELKAAPDARVWGDADTEVLNNRATDAGLVNIPVVQKYLDELLQKIRTEAGVPQWPGKVYIKASNQFNAHTQNSGNIYINIGLLNVMESEDELIGLLAHEFAHSYLQYDQMQKTVIETDRASDIAATMTLIGQRLNHQGLAANVKEDKAMRAAAGVLMTYQLSRNLLSPAWSRSQEYAADDMAVQLSIRMGYSVPDGWVRVLERMHSHEKKQETLKGEQREYLRKSFEAVRDAEFAKMQQGGKGDVGGAVVNEVLGNLSFVGKDLTGLLTSTHPDLSQRIARVNALHEQLIGDKDWPEKRNGPWQKIKDTRSVQRLFTSYLNAGNAQAVLGTPRDAEATKLARMSLVQETQGHALPALVNLQAQPKVDNSVLNALRANMRSPQHRAWRSYVVYAEYELERNRKTAAQRTLDEGFQHFERSHLAWEDYIRLQVRMGNLDAAQSKATACTQKFKPHEAAGCTRAAQPPQPTKRAGVGGDWGWVEGLFGR